MKKRKIIIAIILTLLIVVGVYIFCVLNKDKQNEASIHYGSTTESTESTEIDEDSDNDKLSEERKKETVPDKETDIMDVEQNSNDGLQEPNRTDENETEQEINESSDDSNPIELPFVPYE